MSAKFKPINRVLTSTSSGPTSGSGSVPYCKTSASPNSVKNKAFMLIRSFSTFSGKHEYPRDTDPTNDADTFSPPLSV